MIAEGTPSQLRSTLEGSIVEVRGRSIPSMRQAAEKIKGVEDVRAFGDKLHLRVVSGRAETVIDALADAFPAQAGGRVEARLVPPTLEDVFILLSRDKD
jgi:hypothetical protein